MISIGDLQPTATHRSTRPVSNTAEYGVLDQKALSINGASGPTIRFGNRREAQPRPDPCAQARQVQFVFLDWLTPLEPLALINCKYLGVDFGCRPCVLDKTTAFQSLMGRITTYRERGSGGALTPLMYRNDENTGPSAD